QYYDLMKIIKPKDKKNDKSLIKKESEIFYNSDETCFNAFDDNKTELKNNKVNEKIMFEAYLLFKDEGSEEKILIDNKNFIVGREKENCDYYISDKRISKMHFAIVKYEKEFFIKDLNSTNGTYLNGNLLEKNKLARISNNDVINISDNEYIFKQ
ncbi:FHA domain-containing protein, partial [Clostridiaceae bacterium HSG29]|nr:FHA domain-containing protein [Clostridiaceae bacterium HSG29]